MRYPELFLRKRSEKKEAACLNTRLSNPDGHCWFRSQPPQNCYSHTFNQEFGRHRTNRYYPFFTFPIKASLWSKHICLLKEQAYNSNLVPAIIRRHYLIQDRDSQSLKNHLFLGRLCPQFCSNDTTCFPLSSRVRHQKSEALLESNRSSYHQLPSQASLLVFKKKKKKESILTGGESNFKFLNY